jgi:hypothetical protein
LIIGHFEFTLDKDKGCGEGGFVVGGDLEFTDNVETGNGNFGSEIVLKGGREEEWKGRESNQC